MKGLLLKDFINLKKQLKIILVIIIFYIFLSITSKNSTFFSGVISILCAMFPMTALSYDERAQWDKYALSMPVSRKDMVMSKYILGLIFSIAAFALNIVFLILVGHEDFFTTLATAAVISAVGLIWLSFMLPVIFKLGVEKSRMIIMMILFLPAVGIGFLAKLNISMPSTQTLNILAFTSPLIILTIVVASIFISLNIYEKKEM